MENNDYLNSVIKQFEYYKSLGDKAFAQVSDEHLFWQCNEDSNSIATIVKHLWGNMRSRWTDFYTRMAKKPGATANPNLKMTGARGQKCWKNGKKDGPFF